MNIFVGNLSFDANEGDVKKLFEGFGNVASAVIVMRKEKKAPKSRGFGFVQMPDEQQALAAITALNGKEFMGRVLDVNPARPKTEAHPKNELRKKMQPKFEAGAKQYPRKETEQKKTWFSPVFNKSGAYKGGRRTRSYMKRRGLAGIQEEAKPRRRNQDNPMRWRKKKDQAKPWQKSPGEHKPWEKVEGSERPQKSRFKDRRKPGGYKR
jgi:RNA recognition motif-containing protein